MFLLDIILLICILGFAGAGAKDGFVQTSGRLIGAIIGFVAARAWSMKVAPVLAIIMPFGWARLIAFVIIFIFITQLIGFIFKILDGAFRIISILPFLKSINALLGGIIGCLEGVLIIGGIIYLIKVYALDPTLVTWLNLSKISPYILGAFKALLGLLL